MEPSRPTFWKPTEYPDESVRVNRRILALVEPLGEEKDVQSRILSIPNTYPFPNLMGYKSIFWPLGIEVCFRSEPEFGEDKVFSLTIHQQSATPRAFFKFYLQLFEAIGAVLLANGRFVSVMDFKRKL
jgi:hypothetical protein